MLEVLLEDGFGRVVVEARALHSPKQPGHHGGEGDSAVIRPAASRDLAPAVLTRSSYSAENEMRLASVCSSTVLPAKLRPLAIRNRTARTSGAQLADLL